MQKLKRIFALIAAIALIIMYVVTMLIAVFGGPDSQNWLIASIVVTVVVSVLGYAISLAARTLSGRNTEEEIRKAEREAAREAKQAAEQEKESGARREAEQEPEPYKKSGEA